MYQNLQANPIIKNILCVSYTTLQLNENTNRCCAEVFPQGIPDNATIVYSPSDKGIIVLGYYVLDTLNMSESIYFNALRNNTLQYKDFDPQQEVKSSTCIHIKDWVFDESLRDTIWLRHIFLTIISSIENNINNFFVWYDGHKGEVLFYPIKMVENPLSITKAIFYFSHKFMYE